MRTLVREAVYKYIYSKLFNPDDEGLFDVLIKDFSQEDKDFGTKLKGLIVDNESEYLDKISELSIGYKINRIHMTDKCALLIGMVEFDYFKETPKIVIIDEAVKLAAKYSTDNSPDFVNGILATYTSKE